jgi:hypothetical protein
MSETLTIIGTSAEQALLALWSNDAEEFRARTTRPITAGVSDDAVLSGGNETSLYETWAKRKARRAAEREAAITKAVAGLEQTRKSTRWAVSHMSRSEALAMGSPRYIGRPCVHGHSGERYANHGGCVECSRVGAEQRRRREGKKVRGPRLAARHRCRSERRAAARSRRAEEYGADTPAPLWGR